MERSVRPTSHGNGVIKGVLNSGKGKKEKKNVYSLWKESFLLKSVRNVVDSEEKASI